MIKEIPNKRGPKSVHSRGDWWSTHDDDDNNCDKKKKSLGQIGVDSGPNPPNFIMKLLRVGNNGHETPAIVDKKGILRSLSSIIPDLTPNTLNIETIQKIEKKKFKQTSRN